MRLKAIHYLLLVVALNSTGFALSDSPSDASIPSFGKNLQQKEQPSVFNRFAAKVKSFLGFEKEEENQPKVIFSTSGDHYEDAVRLIELGDHNSAIIHLRNLIKKEPGNLAAYLLLSETYLQNHKPASAELLLLQAQKIGVDRTLTTKYLAQSYYDQDKFHPLLDSISTAGLNQELKAEINVLKAKAYSRLRDFRRSKDMLDNIIRVNPEFAPAHIELAWLKLTLDDVIGAVSQLEFANKTGINNPEYWYFKGEIAKRNTQYEEAINYYNKAIELDPQHTMARLDRAELFLDSGSLNKAEIDIKKAQQYFPDEIRGLLLQAVLLSKQGDQKASQEILRKGKILAEKLNFLQLQEEPHKLILLASIYHFDNQIEKSAQLLSRFLELNPHNTNALTLLASLQMELQQFEKAQINLEKAVNFKGPDARLLVMQAEVESRTNNDKKAIKLLRHANRLAPNNKELQKQLALALSSSGNTDEAISILKTISTDSEESISIRLTLANFYIQSGKIEHADKLVQKLFKSHENSPQLHYFAGLVAIEKQDTDAAVNAFNKALLLSPGYPPALFKLADLNFNNGNLKQSKDRYHEILNDDPNNTIAMKQLSVIAETNNSLQEAINWLKKILEIEPDIEAGLHLVDLHLATGAKKEAESVLKLLTREHPEKLNILAASATWSMKNDNVVKAKNTFQKMAQIANEKQSIHWLIRIAAYQQDINDSKNSKITLDAAIRMDEENVDVLLALGNYYINLGDSDSALKTAYKILEKSPERPAAYILLGNTYERQMKREEAQKWYKAGLEKTKGSSALVNAYYQSLLKNHHKKDAVATLEEWVVNNPQQDLTAVQKLAAGHADLGNYKKAISLYERLNQLSPNDPYLLNNLAYLYWTTGSNKSRARDYAEKAYELAPQSSAVLDTLGWIMTNQGGATEAVPLLRNAAARSADDAEVRYHYAVALYQSGNSVAAIRELRKSLNQPSSFTDIDQAKALLAKLEKI